MTNTNTLLIRRIKEEMELTGINARELSRRAKVGGSFIYDILSGKSANPTTGKITAVANALGTTMERLLSSDTIKDSPVKRYIAEVDSLEGYTASSKRSPFFDNIFFISKEWLKKTLGCEGKEIKYYYMQDDSMSPTLQKGDMVIINTSLVSAKEAGIFAVCGNNGTSIKRLDRVFKKEGDLLYLSCDNEKYNPHICREGDIKIIGKVVWFSRAV